MNKYILAVIATISTIALAQHQPCLEPAPSRPPVADMLVCQLPTDGGTICTCVGSCPSCKAGVTITATTAQCNAAKTIANRSVVNGNGWNDGGSL